VDKTAFKNRIHNLALDLKSGEITWEEFDKELDEIVGGSKTERW